MGREERTERDGTRDREEEIKEIKMEKVRGER